MELKVRIELSYDAFYSLVKADQPALSRECVVINHPQNVDDLVLMTSGGGYQFVCVLVDGSPEKVDFENWESKCVSALNGGE